MGGGKGGQTIGYHYLFSMLFGIGRGPINQLRAIKAADKVVWDGNACSDDIQIIDKPDLFGGEKKEGGIQGLFRVLQGSADQVIPTGPEGPYQIAGNNGGTIDTGTVGTGGLGFGLFGTGAGPNSIGSLPDLKTSLGGNVGELRGRVCVWFDGLIASMNPYIKEWSFRVRRTWAGWDRGECWYQAKATIYLKDSTIHAMNPAHILYETCTNRSWGRGLDPTKLGPSWVYAADVFCAESFGLCLVWYRKDDIDNFVQSVCDMAGCVIYTDRETGLIEIKLLRADYDPDDLPHFTPDSGLVSILEDDSGSSDAIMDEVVVSGLDPITNQKIDGRAHNLAVRQSRDGAASVSRDYSGLPTVELCNRVAARDLAVGASGLRKFRVVLDRAGFRLHPGAVFKVSDPSRNISNMVLRAGLIDDTAMVQDEIRIGAVQDVFGLPSSTWVASIDNTWTPPSTDPVAAEDERLFELGYRDIFLRTSKDTADSVAVGDSYAGSLVGRPDVTETQYRLIDRVAGDTDWNDTGTFYFTANAALVADIGPTDTIFDVSNPEDFEAASGDLIGDSILIGEERMRIEAYTAPTFTVARGVLDTWPAAHSAGDRVWLPDDDFGADSRLYAAGESLEAKVLPRTSSGQLSVDDAVLLTIDLDGRPARPYPPADVTVNGVSIYGTLVEGTGEPAFNWVERNRVTQADHLVGFFEPTVAAEAGTTYRIRIYDTEISTPEIATYDGITPGWVYTTSDQAIDGVDDRSAVWCELVSVRDGVESWKPTRFRVVLHSGYGLGYGYNYGGV